MTSDFDNDEIQDSAFPVDFNDDTTSLDLYGVWVKSGPRDAGSTAGPNAGPTAGEAATPEREPEFSADLPDYSDISLLPDLPDFSAVEDLGYDDGGSDTETVQFSERAPTETETVPESEFDTIDTETFFDMTEAEPSTNESPLDASFDSSEIVFEDIQSHELETSSGAPKKAVPEKPVSYQEPAESRVFESVDIFEMDDLMTDETAMEETGTAASAGELSGITELPEFSDSPEFDLDDSFGSELHSSDSETFELEDPATFSTDTTDLDSFINDFNESGGSDVEDKEKLSTALDPVDIDLDFDESFIADAEKIKATGSAVTQSEYTDSEFGVELVEEATDSSFPDFDTSFGMDLDDEPPSKSAELHDTDEFDELLVSLDNSPSPVQASRPDEKTQKKLYDLSVSEEESEEILDIPVIKDYNSPASGPDSEKSVTSSLEGSVSLDFDDISAVEQELNDLTPDTGDETVVSNDKSTQLLMMIAEELASIKNELSTLKTEIAGFKVSGIAPEQAANGAGIDDTDNSGFFNDDDTDETIALTGDELNNILITADFTEEKNEDTDISGFSPDSMQADESVERAEINFEVPVNQSDFNGYSADMEDGDIPDTLPDSIFEIPDFDIAIPVKPAHVNKIDDDISYLEGADLSDTVFDDLSLDEPELEIIDFDDEKLEEPELAEFNIDLSAMDSAFPAEQEVSVPADFGNTEERVAEVEAEVESLGEMEPEGQAQIEEIAAPAEPASAPTPPVPPAPANATPSSGVAAMPVDLKDEIKSVLAYMDQLLESLPEEKIEEFARSEHFEVYRKLFEELGIS